MKIIYHIILLLTISLFFSCNDSTKSKEVVGDVDTDIAKEQVSHEGFDSYGEEISPNFTLKLINMTDTFEKMKVGDSLNLKAVAEVKEVCQAKGCWMKLELARGEEMMVKFKDYGFFVPKDIAGKEVVISGKAFIEEMSVEDQQHYAMDEGKSEEEIAAITEPKKTYSFLADGVLVKSE